MKPIVDLNQVERLLILKVSSMGDIVHASPVASALKRAFPHLKIGWVAEDRHAGVIEGSPCIDKLHIVPYKALKGGWRSGSAWRAVRQLAREIRAERYQVALDLQGLLKSALWAVLGGVPVRLGGHRMRELTPLFMRRLPVEENPKRHVVQQYLDAVRLLGAPATFPELYRSPEEAHSPTPPVLFPLTIPPTAEASALQKLEAIDALPRFISMNPSAGRVWKRWEIARFAELSDRIESEWGIPVVFVGGPGDKPLESQLAMLKRAPLRSLIGATSIKEVMAVVRYSFVHVCGDTGTAHIASAFGVPCVSLFGPTDPDRTGPYGQRERALCLRDQCTACPKARCVRHECLQWITVEQVMGMVQRTVADSSTVTVPRSASSSARTP